MWVKLFPKHCLRRRRKMRRRGKRVKRRIRRRRRRRNNRKPKRKKQRNQRRKSNKKTRKLNKSEEEEAMGEGQIQLERYSGLVINVFSSFYDCAQNLNTYPENRPIEMQWAPKMHTQSTKLRQIGIIFSKTLFHFD